MRLHASTPTGAESTLSVGVGWLRPHHRWYKPPRKPCGGGGAVFGGTAGRMELPSQFSACTSRDGELRGNISEADFAGESVREPNSRAQYRWWDEQ